jgi:Tol biopolymer transport system component
MNTPQRGISLADLSSAGIRLHPSQAAAITTDVIRRTRQRLLPGIPSAAAIRLMPDGSIVADGDVAAGESVERAGRLLDSMLPSFEAPPEFRAPGALRIVVARALRTLDLPPYRSLDEFDQAVARFAAHDSTAVASLLCESWRAATRAESAMSSPQNLLTISDIRRARRSTGLTLSEVAARSHIPVSLLRELEWGYLPNWPTDQYGRVQLVRYARAAGLDEEIVLGTVWPLLQQAIRSRGTRVVDADIVEADIVEENTVETGALATRAAALPQTLRSPERSVRRRTLQAASAVAALVAVSFVPALWFDRDAAAPAGQPAADARASEPQREPASVRERPDAPVPSRTGGAVSQARTGAAHRQRVNPQAQPARLDEDVAFSPAFATTGSAVFYHSSAVGNSAIMRADTDANGDVLRVTRIVNDNAQNFHARPSPDGRMIAFDSDRDGERAVYIADADGRNVKRASGEGFAAVPSWSPDGQRLTFVRAEPNRPRVWNLWMADLATGDTTRLTAHSVGQPWGAAWFPDGDRIAYSHEDRLIVRALDGSSQQIYPSPRRGRLLRTPAVSPDGRRIVFQVYKDGAWILDLQDGSMTRILTDPTAEEFSWSPDGRRVAYHSRKSGTWSVWMMAPR